MVAGAALLWLLPTAARAEVQPGTKLCFGALELKGLKSKARKKTHLKIVKDLRSYRATIPKDTYGMVIEPDCLEDPKCIVWALEDVDPVDGVLAVFATRKRRKVHITVQFYDGKTGAKAYEEKLRARSRRFPRKARFKGAIGRGLEALQRGDVHQEPQPEPAQEVEEIAAVATTPADEVSGAEPAAPKADEQFGGAPTDSGAAEATSTKPPREARDDGDFPVMSVVGWSGVGLGAALVATGAITGVLAMQMDGDLQGQCNQSEMTCANNVADDYEQMRTMALVTDILMGVGVAVTAVGGGALVAALLGGSE